MLIQASQILDLPVAALDTKSKITKVHGFIIDPENGKLIALTVKIGGLFKQTKIISSGDILEFDKNGIVIKSEDDLLDLAEIVRAEKIIKENIKIFGQRAITESGKRLGKVSDLLIDTDTLIVMKFYISNLLDDRILPYDKVVKIDKNAVVFFDDVIDETPVAQAQGVAA